MKLEPVLELDDATVIKGERRVLDGLTLTVPLALLNQLQDVYLAKEITVA